VNSSLCEKDEETGSLRKVRGEKGKESMDDLYVKAPKFGGIIRESPSIHFVYKKWGLRDGSDSEHDSEANFKHGGHKRHETVPTDIGLSLEDDFFDDIETYLTELAKLDEVFFIFFPPFF